MRPATRSISFPYVTGMLKGPSGNMMGLKAGNAQTGALQTKWAGARPPGYSPMKKQGAIVLGTGGDGSNYGAGTFFEGAITSGNPPDATDDAVQANIVAAGYGNSRPGASSGSARPEDGRRGPAVEEYELVLAERATAGCPEDCNARCQSLVPSHLCRWSSAEPPATPAIATWQPVSSRERNGPSPRPGAGSRPWSS